FTSGFQLGNDVNEKGALAGLQGGYNWQFGHFVVGADADVSLSDISGTASCLGERERSECKPFVNMMGSVGAKAGYESGNNLFYARLGYGWMNDVERLLN